MLAHIIFMKAVLQRGLNQKANAHCVEHQFIVHIPNLKNKTLRPSMKSFFDLRIKESIFLIRSPSGDK